MLGGIPDARMAVCVSGGCGHLLFRMQVSSGFGMVAYEQTQLFCAAVDDQIMCLMRQWLLAQVGQWSSGSHIRSARRWAQNRQT